PSAGVAPIPRLEPPLHKSRHHKKNNKRGPTVVVASSSSSSWVAFNGGEQDHYAVLGLERTATSADIKKAYRLLPRKYHPDVSKHSQACELFKSVRHAYETLGSLSSLTFSSVMALFDRQLDAEYKIGYFIAWILGGRGGVLLVLCLHFASLASGKTSSSTVAPVVAALCVGSNLASIASVPVC
ncbi:hypothetical protein D5086_033127, partial [Populus alba]